ncbi:MAG: cob(I)yrinic acid a,c-diamide adenosyltransferase [Deferribacterales bacterium]|nr:cob(I)yrinic acid a,c-diamide adenosyltransferase [Deferribacterales bacterium]
MKEKGYIQVYTGNGKGKTTSCMGLALRAAGAGFKVFIGQFLKGMKYSELESFKKLAPNVEIQQLGGDYFVFGKPSEEDIRMARDGLQLCRNKMLSGEYDVIIMDEINVACHIGLVPLEDVLSLMDEKPEHTELIMSGRYAHQEVMDKADLVTEMREIKHYYNNGVEARVGIEK